MTDTPADETNRLVISIDGIDQPLTPIRQAIHDALAAQVGDVLLENYEIVGLVRSKLYGLISVLRS